MARNLLLRCAMRIFHNHSRHLDTRRHHKTSATASRLIFLCVIFSSMVSVSYAGSRAMTPLDVSVPSGSSAEGIVGNPKESDRNPDLPMMSIPEPATWVQVVMAVSGLILLPKCRRNKSAS